MKNLTITFIGLRSLAENARNDIVCLLSRYLGIGTSARYHLLQLYTLALVASSLIINGGQFVSTSIDTSLITSICRQLAEYARVHDLVWSEHMTTVLHALSSSTESKR
jgi:hypothetical protein